MIYASINRIFKLKIRQTNTILLSVVDLKPENEALLKQLWNVYRTI